MAPVWYFLHSSVPQRRIGLGDGVAPEHALFFLWEVGAGMVDAAIVPDQQVVWRPFMGVGEFRLLGMLDQLDQQPLALVARHADDIFGHQAAEIERLAA